MICWLCRQFKRVGRGALILLKRPARLNWRAVAERRVRPDVVVVVAPQSEFPSGISQAVEQLFIQQLVAQGSVERLDEAILLRLARVNVVPLNLVGVGPL